MSEPEQPELGSLRKRLAETLPDDAADLIWRTIESALETTKSAWGSCKSCGKRVEVQVRDSVSAVRAAQLLLEQLEGRPGVAGDGAGGGQVVLVKWCIAGLDGAPSTDDCERWAALAEQGDLVRLQTELTEAAAAATRA